MRQDEKQFVSAIRKGGREGERALLELYRRHRKPVSRYVRSNSGSAEEAMDVLQDAMVILHRNICRGKFREDSSIGTYLHSIVRFRWLRQLKRKKREAEIMAETEGDSINGDPGYAPVYDKKEKRQEVERLLSTLGEKCRKLLLYIYYYQYSTSELTEEMGYENEQVVRNKKYRCMKKLKERISEEPGIIELIRD